MNIRNAIVFAVLCVAAAANAQVIANGSLTGPPGPGVVPGPWYVWQNTPDTADTAGPFNFTGTPWTPSPDGGTFVRGIGTSNPAGAEGFAQTVSGFSVGTAYQIDIFQTNLGFFDVASMAWVGDRGYWDLIINGVLVDSSNIIDKQLSPSDPIVWSNDTLTFVAPTTTVEIAFLARSTVPGGPPSYMGIDGIRLKQVPAPGVLAALGGLAMITRRRRN
ncbi:MAG: hypothetical protein AAGB51_09695 [Planctomycetota bacterium]